jgi:raffinose synthase
MGSYHAAGRAVGGCPVYVSDKPDQHNFDLLRKMVLPDGGILRATKTGRPTLDCLFHDPTSENVLLKIFNTNTVGGAIGVFNARFDGEPGKTAPISGSVSPADVYGLDGDQFAVYSHQARTLSAVSRDQKLPITLPELTWELFTVMPIEDGFAPIGLTNMLNSGGAVTSVRKLAHGGYEVALRGGGTFVAYSQKKPTKVEADGRPVEFEYDAAAKSLTVSLPVGKPVTVVVRV